MWHTVLGNTDAVDQILSNNTVFYPPDVGMQYIIDDIALKIKYGFFLYFPVF
jgi:hypothetical protein